jgi:hypothetical protein
MQGFDYPHVPAHGPGFNVLARLIWIEERLTDGDTEEAMDALRTLVAELEQDASRANSAETTGPAPVRDLALELDEALVKPASTDWRAGSLRRHLSVYIQSHAEELAS